MVFLWLHHENRLVGNLQYYIRNQCIKIRKYGEFDRNRKVHLFGTSPVMDFGSFFLNLIFLENVFRAKICWILKIDIFIRYKFCGKYFFPKSIFIDMKWKNLLENYYFYFWSWKSNLNWEKLPIVCLSIWFHLTEDDLNWEKLPIVCLSVWFHLISFFLKNNGFRAKMSEKKFLNILLENMKIMRRKKISECYGVL